MQDDDLFREGASLLSLVIELATNPKNYKATMETQSEVSTKTMTIRNHRALRHGSVLNSISLGLKRSSKHCWDWEPAIMLRTLNPNLSGEMKP
jgi:hypothetical protein